MNKEALQKLVSMANYKARDRNRPKPPTPRQSVLNQFLPEVGNEATATGTALSAAQILARIKP